MYLFVFFKKEALSMEVSFGFFWPSSANKCLESFLDCSVVGISLLVQLQALNFYCDETLKKYTPYMCVHVLCIQYMEKQQHNNVEKQE